MSALDHFKEDIARANAIVAHAGPLPPGPPDDKRLRDDLLRSAWMFGVGALDAYFCDLYTDLLASVLMSKERQRNITLPKFILKTEVPLDAVYADYQHRQNWRWRMMARQRMERENVLSTDTVKYLLNPFLRNGNKLFADVIDVWISKPGATKRIFGKSPADYEAQKKVASGEPDADKRKKREQGLRNNAASSLVKRISKLIQRRHDCIHNCDRPRMSPQPLDKGGTVVKVIQDIEFLVYRSDEHITTEFREFLVNAGCSAVTVAQAGY